MPIVIPVDAHIVTLKVSGGSVPSNWTKLAVKQVFNASKLYWEKTANISFSLQSTTEEKPIELPSSSSIIDDAAYFFLVGKYKSQNNNLTMLLINKFSSGSVDGRSTEIHKACMIRWHSTLKPMSDALSHELGHLLALPHINKPGDKGLHLVKLHSNLMYSGIHGEDLTAEQIKAARHSKLAKLFGGP